MIRLDANFGNEPDKKSNQNVNLPSDLYQNITDERLPAGFKLTDDAKTFFESDGDEKQRIHRQAIAEGQISIVEQELSLLATKRDRIENEINRFAQRRRVPNLNWDVVGSVTAIPFALLAAALVAAATFTFTYEFDFAHAAILEGQLFETPAADPRLPAIEPEFGVVMGMAIAPVFGLFVVLEFISLTMRDENSTPFAKVLAGVALPLSLATTGWFAWVVGGGMSSAVPTNLSFQPETPPWYYFALSITTTSLINAMLFYGVVWILLQCFEFEPREKPFCEGLERTSNRLLERIRNTAETLSILYGATAVEQATQRFEKLKSKLDVWTHNRN
jgi:hypothetical protein